MILAALAGVLAANATLLAQAEPESALDEVHSAYNGQEDSAVAPVNYFQEEEGMGGTGGMTQPPAQARSRSPVRRGPSSQQANYRLASVPNMFGDFFFPTGSVRIISLDGSNFETGQGSFTLPAAGGSRRVKISENNKALPDDRIYFMYNHFHNALTFQQQSLAPPGPFVSHQQSVDRYTAGIEKMFWDDLWSVEVRMPLTGNIDYSTPQLGVQGGNVGNLAVILKNLLYTSENCAVAAGLGLDIPTGSDVDAQYGDVNLNFQNDAFHLLPYIGLIHTHQDTLFLTAFAQVDLATSGNEVLLNNESLGYFTEQNLLYLDLAVGSFLFNDPTARRLTSVAVSGEVHYTSTMQDTDVIAASDLFNAMRITNPYNRQDIVNGTVAVQFAIANTTNFRVAGVFPLGSDIDQRYFDSELQFQVNRRF
jgi:hypothetical protein